MTRTTQGQTEEIRAFWEQQARTHRGESLATNPDRYGHELEIQTFIKHLADFPEKNRLLDVGCGNGHITIELARRLPNIVIQAGDYSQEMIANARVKLAAQAEQLQRRVTFAHLDILTVNPAFVGQFDLVITSRCLINLTSFEQQKTAIDTIREYLRPGGIYLMNENLIQGHDRVNEFRALLGLPEIPVRWHNLYFDQDQLLPFLEQRFTLLEIDHFESTYVLSSRVLNAALTPEGQPPSYEATINLLSSKLPAVGDLGPTKMIVLRKGSS